MDRIIQIQSRFAHKDILPLKRQSVKKQLTFDPLPVSDLPYAAPSGFVFTTGLKPVPDRNRPVRTRTQNGVVPDSRLQSVFPVVRLPMEGRNRDD